MITVHNVQMRIMGLSVDPRVNHLYSISESGYLIVTDASDKTTEGGKFLNSQNLSSSNAGLKAMIHDLVRNILFVASGDGKVFILNSLPTQPELLQTIETDQKVCIRGLTRSNNIGGFSSSEYGSFQKTTGCQNFLLASDINGYITIFDIGTAGKEKNTRRIGNTQGKPK